MVSRGSIGHAGIIGFLLLWVVGFGFSLDDALRRTAYPPVFIDHATSASGFPALASVKSGFDISRSGLRVGDELLKVGDTDLRGVGELMWFSAFSRFSGSDVRVPITYRRAGAVFQTKLSAGSYARFWPRIVASAVFAACALFLLVSLKPTALVRGLIHMNLAAGLLFSSTFVGGPVIVALSLAVGFGSASLVMPLTFRAYQLFPDGTPPRTRLGRFGPWAFSLLGLLDMSRFQGVPFPRAVGGIGSAVLAVAFIAVLVPMLARTFRRADPVGRRQVKWVLLGAYLAMVPFTILVVFAAFEPAVAPWVAIALCGTAINPICLVVAITRHNFMDIDRLLSSTASLTIVLTALLAFIVMAVPIAAEGIEEWTGMRAMAAQIFLIAILSGAVVLVHSKLRPQVERLLFAQRHAVDRGMANLVRDLTTCLSAEDLANLTGERMHDVFRPASTVIYSLHGDVYAPAFLRGDSAAPRFSGTSPLVTVLREQSGALCTNRAPGSEAGLTSLGSFQRAVLETLDVPVVVPIHLAGDLVGFLCLGKKTSGDLYTPTDLALLTLLADKLSSEMRRFGQSQLIEASQQMQDRLRKYVPGRLAESLDRGENLDVGEIDVSILFVDIRGYSRYVEGLPPEEIFGTVNRFAETVSSAIQDHGGTVVEFNGDGMMAVFGAPQQISAKEASAVSAGRGILERMSSVGGAKGELSVGIGVATGPAFVGHVQAVDRIMWTALGNTTNLASRLQALTRELNAAMIIDDATRQAASSETEDFLDYGEAKIRGRERLETLHLLPLPAPA